MTVILVMDRDGWDQCTDNMVVVDVRKRILHWVPRDLWCPTINDRVNRAFALGGHPCVAAALGHLGFDVNAGGCFQPVALKRLFDECKIVVPVRREMCFFYPLRRDLSVQSGSKVIKFSPPSEELCGERLHQWVGARKSAHNVRYSDLDRIQRQQLLIRRLLEERFPFRMPHGEGVSIINFQQMRQDIGQIDLGWSMTTFGKGRFRHATIDKKRVLILKSDPQHSN